MQLETRLHHNVGWLEGTATVCACLLLLSSSCWQWAISIGKLLIYVFVRASGFAKGELKVTGKVNTEECLGLVGWGRKLSTWAA